jgi:hypothetical protein
MEENSHGFILGTIPEFSAGTEKLQTFRFLDLNPGPPEYNPRMLTVSHDFRCCNVPKSL